MARVAPDATAWPNRDAHFVMNVHARWRDKADDAACIAWARGLFEAAAPFAIGQRLRQFHAGGRVRPGRERLWRELPPAGRDQAPLRSRQPVPHEPEHPTDQRAEGTMNELVRQTIHLRAGSGVMADNLA